MDTPRGGARTRRRSRLRRVVVSAWVASLGVLSGLAPSHPTLQRAAANPAGEGQSGRRARGGGAVVDVRRLTDGSPGERLRRYRGGRRHAGRARVDTLRYEAPSRKTRPQRPTRRRHGSTERHATANEPTPAPAPSPPVEPGGVTEIVLSAASEFGLDGGYLLSVASCESGLDPAARNPAGYFGLFQFDLPTWSAYGYGSIYDAQAQARTAARLLAAGQSARWPNCA